MTENQDVIDGGGAVAAGEKPQFLNVLVILSYIGKSLQALMWLIGTFSIGTLMSFISSNSDKIMEQVEAQGDMPEGVDMEQAEAAMDTFMGLGSGILVGFCVFMLILQILAIIGVGKMSKLKRGGFILYVVFNGIYALLMLVGGWPIALLTIAFIVMYAVNVKHMKA